ncbi:MAG TPA: alpha-amylase family glycosyl hydrolase [Gemmatimonadaceae bacterium]
MRPIATALLAAFVLPLTANAQRPAHTAARADWRRGGVCYEIFVRSFFDSNGDGVGDLNGVAAKLDYVKGLGVRCIWLMPVAESPSYHGYDVSNYYRVQPAYGTNTDFRRLVSDAHERGIEVLVDMVLNHASSRHPYFLSALRDTASTYRSWFRFSSSKPDMRGPWGQVVWHKSPLRDEYYYGVFSSEMPDLNYETPAVREEAKKIARFWLDSMHVDGFRLDAVPYLVESDGQLVNTPGTHAVLREYAAYVHRVRPNAFTVGEVWDSIGAQLPYYPDQLDDYFTFEASDAIINAVNSGSATRLLGPFERMQASEPPTRWSPFLKNHDETRTLTALNGDVGRAKQAATLLLTLPGLPFVYYGEEIGMTGDKPDERIRTPMQWTTGPAAGFTSSKPWEPLQPDTATANVQVESADRSSLLSLYRRLIHLRASNGALGSGQLIALATDSTPVAAYLRADGTRVVLVVANLAARPQSDVRIWSRRGALPAGRYRMRALLGGAPGTPFSVDGRGQFGGFVPVPTLAPHATYLFQLVKR